MSNGVTHQPNRKSEDNHKKKNEISIWVKYESEALFIFCVVGIYIFYLYYGKAQEQLNAISYGEEKKKFGFTGFLLFSQCVFNVLSAWIVSLIVGGKKDSTPFLKYGFVSTLLVISTYLSNHSIRYISYPSQVLAKSCKPVPVLIMGVLFFKRKYNLLKYFIVVIVCIGIAIFMYPRRSKSNITNEGYDHITGYILLFSSLMMDGIMGPFQDKMVRTYRPSATHMMLNTNIWNCMLFAIITFLTGEFKPAFDFIFQYPEVIPTILVFCITSAIGQQFIFLTTNKLGSLNCSTITTTRKFFSILASIFWFGHKINSQQWFAIGLVFFGLGLDVVQSYASKPKIN
ncbi:Galactose transporter [Tieghemostelium lacteum]|uniref:Galactose transporter n=1 Tax=Tieghemostelium lacteum TaxID=361077 RepID=A0A151ZAT7_TIELA|nr:Galactose transporter [Tieghemostelium lacteum]|eukprot:KYQ91048.1 Galactose transporter [Tieghemostelium lacteum]